MPCLLSYHYHTRLLLLLPYDQSAVTAAEVLVFEPFLDHNKTAAQRQSGAYSNPGYSTAWEQYSSTLQQLVFTSNTTAGARYRGAAGVLQGGYTCSIRAWSDFENPAFLTSTPNFYSHHMDTATQVSDFASTVLRTHCSANAALQHCYLKLYGGTIQYSCTQ
jgi:hypothetical protein